MGWPSSDLKPETMLLLGKKSPAKRAMKAAGLLTIDGSDGPVVDMIEALNIARRIGFPVLLKAESGGGGARDANRDERKGVAQCVRRGASGSPSGILVTSRLFVEKLIVGGRHIEVQILGDRYGNAIHLGERDCSVQRNHQKLIEESPGDHPF